MGLVVPVTMESIKSFKRMAYIIDPRLEQILMYQETVLNFGKLYECGKTGRLGETYQVDSTYPLNNDYVRHNGAIWRCILGHEAIEDKVPVNKSRYWERVDYCGKTLDSCKSRFQAVISTTGIVSARKDTTKELPFGAYPGSAKFS